MFIIGLHLLDLPEEILVNILKYVPESDLLLSCRKVNGRFCSMIENYSDLFRNVTFDDCNVLDETTLMVIFKHVSKIEILEIAHQQIEVDAYTFDTIISSLKMPSH